MRIEGKLFEKPNEVVCFIFRHNQEPIEFRAQAVLDYKKFDGICPAPEPPKRLMASGEVQTLFNDPIYDKKITEWATQRSDWMILESLKATPGLTWDTIDADQPRTWKNFRSELEAAFFTPMEITKIINAVMEACGFTSEKVEEAHKSFLAGQGKNLNNESSLSIEQIDTPSGEHVKD